MPRSATAWASSLRTAWRWSSSVARCSACCARGHGLGQRRLVGQQGLLRQAVAVRAAASRRPRRAAAAASASACAWSTSGAARRPSARRSRRRPTAGAAPAHHRAQVAGVGVEAEQRLGHLRLHAEHVDQEAQRAQVVGQPVEGAGLRRRAAGRPRSWPARRRRRACAARPARPGPGPAPTARRASPTAGRHRDQHLALRRVAEVLVDLLFDLGQRGAQFLHHAAHGLAVGDAAVQLLHPGLERLRLGGRRARRRCAAPGAARASPDRGWSKSPSSSEASRYSRLVATSIASAGRRRRRRCHGLRRRPPAAPRPAPRPTGYRRLQRIADQRELLGQAGQAVQLRRRPPPTRRPWRRPRACAPARSRPGRSGPGAALS